LGSILNRWSFYLSFICIVSIILMSTNTVKDRFLRWFGIHPLELLFYFSLLVFILGIVGFIGAKDWRGVIRSVFTVGFTLVITVFLAYIIFVGHLAE
jgi:hypothetical protein